MEGGEGILVAMAMMLGCFVNVSTTQTFGNVSLCEGNLHKVHLNSLHIENYSIENCKNISRTNQPCPKGYFHNIILQISDSIYNEI